MCLNQSFQIAFHCSVMKIYSSVSEIQVEADMEFE